RVRLRLLDTEVPVIPRDSLRGHHHTGDATSVVQLCRRGLANLGDAERRGRARGSDPGRDDGVVRVTAELLVVHRHSYLSSVYAVRACSHIQTPRLAKF